MQSKYWRAVALLILQALCSISMTTGKTSQETVDLADRISAGTAVIDGTKRQVFNINDAEFAEPRIRFGKSCPVVTYNSAASNYQMSLPVSIKINTLSKPLSATARLAKVTVLDIEVRAGADLVGSGVKSVGAFVNLLGNDEAELILLCQTSERCQMMKDSVLAKRQLMQKSVGFLVIGRVNGMLVKFDAIRSDTTPFVDCNQWVEFHRRVDNSFSFARNWNEYANGFGSPDHRHFWMGLEALHAATNQVGNSNTKCQLRIEAVEAASGDLYWGEWDQFKVGGSQDNYRLSVGKVLGNSGEKHFYNGSLAGYKYEAMEYHSGEPFSTFDRDNDAWVNGSCSSRPQTFEITYGNGGWWFHKCSYFGLTGQPMQAYIQPALARPTMKSSKMMFRCR